MTMNLYSQLNKEYRDLQLKESEKEREAKINRLKRNRIKSAELAKKQALKESVNVSVSSSDSVVDVAVSDENTDVVVSEVNNLPIEDEVIDAPVDDTVVEEPVEEEPIEPEEDDIELKETAEGNADFWANFNADDKFVTDVGDAIIIDSNKDANYILVKLPTQFVAAWNPEMSDGKLVWGQGHYFDSEEEAKEYFSSKLNETCEKTEEACEDREEIKESAEEVGSDIIETIVSKISVEDEELANKVREILSREESVDGVEDEVEEDTLEECEVKSFRVTRMSPTRNLYMIEADLSNGERSYIVGKNFNKEENVLDEAEMFTDRSKANTQFKNMLLGSKKGE